MLYVLPFKSLSTLPLANTLDTVDVVAVGEDPNTILGGIGFLTDHLHADPTHQILTVLPGKREPHILFKTLCDMASGQHPPGIGSASHTSRESPW